VVVVVVAVDVARLLQESLQMGPYITILYSVPN